MRLALAVFTSTSTMVTVFGSGTVKPGQKVALTVDGKGLPGHRGRAQHLLHPVPGVDAAAILVQHGEDVFVEQEDVVGLFVDLVHHRALEDRHTVVRVLTWRSPHVTSGQARSDLTFL